MDYTIIGHASFDNLTFLLYNNPNPAPYSIKLRIKVFTKDPVTGKNIPVDISTFNLDNLTRQFYSTLLVKPKNSLGSFTTYLDTNLSNVFYIDINENTISDTKFSGFHQILFDTRFNGDDNNPAYSNKKTCNVYSSLVNYLNKITRNKTYELYRFGIDYEISLGKTIATFNIISLTGAGFSGLDNHMLFLNILRDIKFQFSYDSYEYSINDENVPFFTNSVQKKNIIITFTNLVQKSLEKECRIITHLKIS